MLYDNPEKTKRYILKSFFRFYLKNLMTSSSFLTESYLRTFRTHYESLNSEQKVTFKDINDSIGEMEQSMEVDSEGKEQLLSFLVQHTNIMDVVMSMD